MNKTILKRLDDFYYWLKLKIEDDDSVFGSRQLFVFVITLCLYIGVSLSIILRLFISPENISTIKPVVLLVVIILYIFFFKIFFKRYSKLEELNTYNSKKYSTFIELFYLLIIAAPILFLSILYLN